MRRLSLAGLAAGCWPWPVPAASTFAAPAGGDAVADPVRRGRRLVFPRDHGAHPGSRIEWWYATGWLQAAGRQALLGFQVTFFRSRTGLEGPSQSRWVPRHLLFAHAAITDLAGPSHRHADRMARWSGHDRTDLRARASTTDADVQLEGWQFRRRDAATARGTASRYETRITANDFSMDLALTATQDLLLQGDAGYSRKGPDERQASHYVTEPQLEARGLVVLGAQKLDVLGRAWIDHEWSDELLHPQAVGWDWIGINLEDGRALTAFQLRRADGSALWAGGSLRLPGEPARPFAPSELRFTPGRRWRSANSHAAYPVHWTVQTPAGQFEVRALMDAQELDGRSSTGTLYWEGLSEVWDDTGRRIGLGYLEMTGYAGRLQL